MPLPDLSTFCIDLDVTPGELCLTFPGGAEVCVQYPSLVPPTPDELVRQLFAQANAALAPLNPFFNVIDVIVAIFDCIKAISTLNPEEIAACLPNLAERIGALLRLIPQLSLPILIAQFIDLLLIYLRGYRAQLIGQREYLLRILAAETAAQRPGNIGLSSVIVCAKDDFRKLIEYGNESATPINRLIGLINLFMESIGLGQYGIPSLANIDPDAIDDSVQALDLAIETLSVLRAALAPLLGEISAPFEAAADIVEGNA